MGSEVEHEKSPLPHVFMISFPSQGHINPLLRLGKRIASKGIMVTFSTTEDFGQGIRTSNDAVSDQPIPVGDGFIRFEFIDEELSKTDPIRSDLDLFLGQLESVGRRRVPEILARLARDGMPVTCLINNPFLPWVSDVAEELGLPSAMLWVQSSACFLSYYYYHHKLTPFPDENALERDVEIPTLPLLKWDEIPTFLHPTTPYGFLRRAIIGQYGNLHKPFCVLADTFYELEKDTLDHTNTLCKIRPVGPLFKEVKSNGPVVRADPIRPDEECLGWLDGKEERSVVYISFGTVVSIKQEQVDEIAAAIEASGLSFLWVMKKPQQNTGRPAPKLPEGFLERVGGKGKVVQFSPQEQVLAHPSIACFMTHCGWNSTIEALSSGVPVLAFPQWGDQVTDAKFICDVFGIGLRLCRGENDRIIPREEVEKCLTEATSGPIAARLRETALKWKAAAESAVAEGGSSDQNIQEFVDEVKKRSEAIFANASLCNGMSSVGVSNGH